MSVLLLTMAAGYDVLTHAVKRGCYARHEK